MVMRLVSEKSKTMKQLAGYIKRELLLPISLVITLLGGFFWLGSLSAKVEEIVLKNSPTRIEFNSMEKQLTDIKTGVDKINSYLLQNNNK